jgi:hypothetical protein
VSDRLACAHVPLYQSLTDAGLSGLNCPGGWGDRLLLPSPMPRLEGESPSDRPKFSPVPWADRIGTQQSVISRLEDADYEGHSLSMLQSDRAGLKSTVGVEFGAFGWGRSGGKGLVGRSSGSCFCGAIDEL